MNFGISSVGDLIKNDDVYETEENALYSLDDGYSKHASWLELLIRHLL